MFLRIFVTGMKTGVGLWDTVKKKMALRRSEEFWRLPEKWCAEPHIMRVARGPE
jgi:hypothetical protein